MLPADPPNKYDQITSPEQLPEGVRALVLRAHWDDKNQLIDGFLYHDRAGTIQDSTPVIIGPIMNQEGDVYETRAAKYLCEVICND